jgi:hypothetical protein
MEDENVEPPRRQDAKEEWILNLYLGALGVLAVQKDLSDEDR